MELELLNKSIGICEKIRGKIFENSKSEISQPELITLKDIVDLNNKGISASVSVISERHNISKSAVSQTVSVLERKGYVIKIQDNKDKRKSSIVITEKGLSKIKEHMEKVNLYIGNIMDKLGDDNLKQLENILDKLEEIID